MRANEVKAASLALTVAATLGEATRASYERIASLAVTTAAAALYGVTRANEIRGASIELTAESKV
jgi:hypothetical protein